MKIISKILICLILCGCSNNMAIKEIPISRNVTIPVPLLGDVGRSVEVTQLVTVHYLKEQIVFEGHISITPDLFTMVGLDAFGRKAITIHWSKDGIIYESASFVPAQLRPENILADIILLYWPEASLRHAMSGSPVTLITSHNHRIIMQGDKKIFEASYKPKTDYWNGNVHYQHFIWGYEMDIKSVELQP